MGDSAAGKLRGLMRAHIQRSELAALMPQAWAVMSLACSLTLDSEYWKVSLQSWKFAFVLERPEAQNSHLFC